MWLEILARFALLVCVSVGPGEGREDPVVPDASVPPMDAEYLDFAVKEVRQHFEQGRATIPHRIELFGMTSQIAGAMRYELFLLVKSSNKRGVPDLVLEALEKSANVKSNDFNYMKITKEPRLAMEGKTLKVVDVALSKSSCFKHNIMKDDECIVADREPPRYRCSAEVYWTGTGLDITNFQMGPF